MVQNLKRYFTATLNELKIYGVKSNLPMSGGYSIL